MATAQRHTEARRRHKERRNGGNHGSAHSPVLPSCSSCLRYARPEGPRGLLQRAQFFLLLQSSRITAEPSTEGGLCGLYDRREFCQMRLEQQEQQEQRGQQAELTESMHMINAWFEACGHLSRQPVSSRRSSIRYLHPASNSWPGRAQDGMASRHSGRPGASWHNDCVFWGLGGSGSAGLFSGWLR